ncbi:MAG: hypothetical protein ABH827_02690 [bacterium]
MKKQGLSISNMLFYTLILLVCVNMGTGDNKYSSKTTEAAFAPLEAKQGSYDAKIYDEATTSDVFNLSFYGHTSIGGILKEVDDSVNTLDLSKIKEIIIEKQHYDSARYRDKDLTLASVISIDGTETKGLLFPRRVTICAEEKGSKIKRSWFISKIDKISIENTPAKLPTTEKTRSKRSKTDQQVPVEEKDKTKEEESKKTAIDTQKEKSTSVASTSTTDKTGSSSGVTNSDFDDKKPKGVIEAFMGIVDSIIDFVKSIIHFFMKLIR